MFFYVLHMSNLQDTSTLSLVLLKQSCVHRIIKALLQGKKRSIIKWASMRPNLSSAFHKARHKPVSTATETSYKIEHLLVACLDLIHSN